MKTLQETLDLIKAEAGTADPVSRATYLYTFVEPQLRQTDMDNKMRGWSVAAQLHVREVLGRVVGIDGWILFSLSSRVASLWLATSR